jgi:hypothetical protein
VTFYDGRVFHSRKHPVKNVFTYPLRFAVVDLDAPPPWFISSGQAAGGLGTEGAWRFLRSCWLLLFLEPIFLFLLFSLPRHLTLTPWNTTSTVCYCCSCCTKLRV